MSCWQAVVRRIAATGLLFLLPTSPQAAPEESAFMTAQLRGSMPVREGGRFGDGPRGRFGTGGPNQSGGRQESAATKNFPKGCRAVCSPFEARTRCDGSTRSRRFPVHQGIDMAVPEGTPVVAIADGVVVDSGWGPSIGGIGLVLQHPPEATGTNSYVYSVYKHLAAVPLPKGTKVRKGQRLASSGKTGTEGIYYGSQGFPHLHFEIHISTSDRWPSGTPTNPVRFLRGSGGRTTWPLACR